MDRHEEIMEGKLSFPPQILKLMEFSEEEKGIVEEYWGALWHSFLNEEGVNGLYWGERFRESGMEKKYIHLNYYLERLLWTSMEISNEFCLVRLNEDKILKWVSKDELHNVRKEYKFAHYRMRYSKRGQSDVVKIGNGIKKTGIVRKGFQKAGRNKFYYDEKAIRKFKKQIYKEVTKKLISGIKDIDYKQVVKELLDWYSVEDDRIFSLGANTSDSRGRAIFDCTKRVFNPVSHKTARAVLEMPEAVKLTEDGWNNVYLFVAELNHVKAKTWEDKIEQGKEYAERRKTSSKCDLHERIWLYRIYENIDKYAVRGWYVPIEIDVQACGLCLLGVLTNDHHFMDGTNLIGNTLKDIWTVPELPREYTKKAITPILYGSGQTPGELWDSHNFEYTQKQENRINNELLDGRFKNVLKFREHLIGNVKPKEKMHVKIWDEEFDVYCNRFKWDMTVPVKYEFLTGTNKAKEVIKQTAMVPDVNAFKCYFATLLLHNIDSQIANYICEEIDWVLPNHDSFICSPNDADYIRELYVEKLQELYRRRHEIMSNYLHSIGIEEEYEDINQKELDIDSFSGHCLK